MRGTRGMMGMQGIQRFFSWRWLFGLKLVFDAAFTAAFYYENAFPLLMRLGFIALSLIVLLVVDGISRRRQEQTWLFRILLLDFLVSASYGYVYLGGSFPNHLFIGITALALFMFAKTIRALVLSCIALLAVYLVTMGGIDWYLYRSLDQEGYFISCSFILFAALVSALLTYYRQARRDTLELYARLMDSHERLLEYAIHTEESAAARERVQIAREIHDSVGHKMTGIWVQMQAARKLAAVDAARSAEMYQESEGLIREALQEIRQSVRAIRDEPVKSASLNESLARLIEDFGRFAEVRTVLEVSGTPAALSGELRLTAYRIVQESLTNARKHGQAKNAKIVLDYADTGFKLCIRNDGSIPSELQPGFGLINLQERVKEWNGEVQFHLDQGSGFAVEVQFPYC